MVETKANARSELVPKFSGETCTLASHGGQLGAFKVFDCVFCFVGLMSVNGDVLHTHVRCALILGLEILTDSSWYTHIDTNEAFWRLHTVVGDISLNGGESLEL